MNSLKKYTVVDNGNDFKFETRQDAINFANKRFIMHKNTVKSINQKAKLPNPDFKILKCKNEVKQTVIITDKISKMHFEITVKEPLA